MITSALFAQFCDEVGLLCELHRITDTMRMCAYDTPSLINLVRLGWAKNNIGSRSNSETAAEPQTLQPRVVACMSLSGTVVVISVVDRNLSAIQLPS